MICSNCKNIIENQAQFCSNCGTQLSNLGAGTTYVAKYPLDYEEVSSLASQIRALFFKELELVVEEEIGPNEYRKYFDQFYTSKFYQNFDTRTEQLAEEANTAYARLGSEAIPNIDQLLDQNFYGFIDHFLILHCKKLHGLDLPQAILKYSSAKRATLDFRQMVLDYMDFEREQDKVYTDLITIPPSKIKNAVQSFLFTQAQEQIYFICDQTVFGSCQEGFAMTDQALYWKSHFNPAQKVSYDELKTIKKEAEWIKINDLFFNVSKAVNLKMMKLLKKIRTL